MAGRPGDARSALAPRPPEGHCRLTGSAPIDQVQVFGRRDSRDTQKALRFFRERRIVVSFVDLATKHMAPAELRRFADRFGPRALVDDQSRAYREAGLAYINEGDAELFERLLRDQRLVRLPLVRGGTRVTVGLDEAGWRSLLTKDAD